MDNIFEESFEEEIIESESSNPIRNEVKDTASLREYLLKEIGIEDKFITGDTENPVELSVNDLTDKQILNIYKHLNNNQTTDITEEEYNIINLIRSGKFEEYIAESLQDVPQSQENNYTDYDYYYWKMKTDYPDLTDEEIYYGYEEDKEKDSFGKKINAIKKQFSELEEIERMNQEQDLKLKELEEIEIEKNNLIELANSYSHLFRFEIPQQIRESVLDDIFNSDNGETSNFISRYIDDPKGLIYTATAIKMLPFIAQEYDLLRKEYEALKNNSVNVIGKKNNNIIEEEFTNLFE